MAQSESKPCNKFNSFRIVTIKKRIWGRSYAIKYFFFKCWNTLRVSKTGSKLFNSIIADGKNFFFEKVMLCLNNGNVAVIVTFDVLLTRMRLKRYFGCSFLKTLYKRDNVFCTNGKVEVTLSLVLGKFFLLTYLEWLLLLLNRHYIRWTPFLCGKNY